MRARDLPSIVTEVRGGTLFIGREGAGTAFSFRPPIFRLALKSIAGLETRSSGKIEANSLRASSLQNRISSSGSISIDSLAADSLDVQILSSGSFSVAGRVEQQDISLSSSGNYFAKNLASRTASVRQPCASPTALQRMSPAAEISPLEKDNFDGDQQARGNQIGTAGTGPAPLQIVGLGDEHGYCSGSTATKQNRASQSLRSPVAYLLRFTPTPKDPPQAVSYHPTRFPSGPTSRTGPTDQNLPIGGSDADRYGFTSP